MRQIVEDKYKETHWDIEGVVDSLDRQVLRVGLTGLVTSVVSKCEICLRNNAQLDKRLALGMTKKGNSAGHECQRDFSELPRQEGYRYLQGLVDTSSVWPEAFPCHNNKAREVH